MSGSCDGMSMLPATTTIFPDAAAVAGEACRRIVAAAQAAIAERGVFRIVLAGGSTPQLTYRLLAGSRQDWSAWEVYWGDERCLPVSHPGRNSYSAHLVWLAQVDIPPGQIHPIPAELGAGQAALIYAATLRDKRPFDLVLLGMGEDGHTASLFPGAVAETETRLVVAVHDAPKPPAERVSLNYGVLRDCREQLILVGGKDKAATLLAWSAGAKLPIARAAMSEACLLADSAAASDLEVGRLLDA